MLSTYLLVSCICILIAAILHVFYWNRFLATIIGLLLRIKFWKQGGSSIWIEIGSIHFSLLAGRILLKDVCYHSSNQTIKVVKARITWRYWPRVTATEDDLDQEHVGGEDSHHPRSFPSCRIEVSIHGFEWFLYNKTMAYDHIFSQMQADPHFVPEAPEPPTRSSRTSGLEVLNPPSVLAGIKAPPIIHAALKWIKHQMLYVDPKHFLPISIELTKCATICGNSSTPNLMVVECHSAQGTFGIVRARSKCDLYKQLLNFKLQDAVLHLVENPDYRETMSNIGHAIRVQTEASSYADRIPYHYLSHVVFAKVWKGLKLHSLFGPLHGVGSHRDKFSVPPKRTRKSLDEYTYVGANFTKVEYATERRIVEAPTLELSYYTDVVGEVPNEATSPRGMGLESYDIGNGDLPPEWGIDLVIHNGVIRYGPWADRQRVHLQRTFFPSTYHDQTMSERRKAGDKRIWTALKVFIELRGKTSMTLPFREASKDWQWDGHAEHSRPKIRESAFLHITAGDTSSISYLIPMIIGPDGYESRLEVHLDTVQVTSSLNDGKLIVAETCRVHAALPAPLKWNAERTWSFTILLRLPVISIIRDHVNMIMDLSRDWSSGPPAEWQQFVPTIYTFEVDLFHFDLNLYANDQNIIDKPLIKDENTIVTLQASRLRSMVMIPLNAYRPEASTLPFSVDVPNLTGSVSLPKWNTQSLYNLGKEQRVLHAGAFRIQGSYYYLTQTRPGNIDQLKLEISVANCSFKVLGWVIRYSMTLRDNYFGSFTHFSTLVEYLDKRARHEIGDPVEKKYRSGKSNSLQVSISLMIRSGSLLLPAGLPGYEKYPDIATSPDDIGASVILLSPELQLDLRSHDHFMDMSLNIGETKGHIVRTCSEDAFFRHECQFSKVAFVIDGIDISANRLFGPPPRTRTYVCVWEIALGSVKAILSMSEGRIATAAMDTFRINYTDLSNAPASGFSVTLDPDLTFVKVSLEALNVTLLAGTTAIDVQLPQGLTVHTNDLQGQICGKLMSLRLPLVFLKALVTSGSPRNLWTEAAYLEFDGNLEFYSPNTKGTTQADFLQEQDALTRRAYHLLGQLGKVQEDIHDARCTSVPRWRSRLSHPVHLNDLYIPPLTLPQFCPQNSIPQHHRQLHRARPFSHWSRPSQLSESEAENVLEVDRDARIAQNRILWPPPVVNADDADQTVSDEESDNEDLVDTDSSESNWSATDVRHSKTLLMRYQHITRRYDGRGLDSCDGEASPFTLVHKAAFPIPRKKTSPHRFHSQQLTLLASADTDYAIRLESIHGVQVFMTPLIVMVISSLGNEYELGELSTELLLDTFMAHHLKKFSVSDPPPSALPSFDVILHSVRVHVVEQVHCKTKADHIGLSDVDTESETVDLTAYCHLTGLLLKGSPQGRVDGSPHLQCSLQTLTAGLGNLSTTQTTFSRPEFCFSLDDVKGSFMRRTLLVSSGSFTMQIGPSDPEYMAALLLAVRGDMVKISTTYKTWRAHSTSSFHVLVRRLLVHTKDHATVDPLSIVQPSFLVQQGVPHALRTNIVFKFLFFLRSALRTCGPLAHADDPILDERDEQRLLTLCLSNLMADSDEKLYHSPWEILRVIQSSSVPKPSFDVGFGSCSFGSLQCTVLSSSARSNSHFTVTTLQFKYQPHSRAVTHPTSHDSVIDHPAKLTLVVATAEDFSLVISPRLLDFAKRIVRVLRHYPINIVSATGPPKTPSTQSLATILVHVGKLNVQARAENLTFELQGSLLNLCSSIFLRSHTEVYSGNNTVTFSTLHIRARSTKMDMNPYAADEDILASLAFTKGDFNAIQRNNQLSDSLRLVFSLDQILLNIPRSALRLYRFIEEWKADFLPGFEMAAGSLISEIKGQRIPIDISGTPIPRASKRNFLFNGTIRNCGITLQIMRGTWLSWAIRDITGFISCVPNATTKWLQNFGLQLQSQILTIYYKSRSTGTSSATPHVKLALPALALTGHQSKNNVDLLVALAFANFMLKPSHWDSLLAVQQKFGRDFTDLMDLIQTTRRARSSSSEVPKVPPATGEYSIHASIKGFRVGLEGPSSTFYLECENVVGDIIRRGGHLQWQIQHRDIALSLAPRTDTTSKHVFDRNQRSAFIIIDIAMTADADRLQMSIPKIQAVMQPSSIGELGDFIDYYQAELLSRRNQRAVELEAFKEKTRTLLRTFEAQSREPIVQQKPSWLSAHTICVEIERIGVAFPLSFDQALELSRPARHDSSVVRAFLFSVRRIKFNTQRGEVGHVTSKELSFQFVHRFRQWTSTDFAADSHKTQNRLCYPELHIHVRSDTSLSKRRIWVAGNVSGFILNLDSSISDYIFSLIDVYRRGRERMERLADRRIAFQASGLHSPRPLGDDDLSTIPPINVFSVLKFESGHIRIHSTAQQFSPMSAGLSDSEGDYTSTSEIEVIKLPMVSAWIEYQASTNTPGGTKPAPPSALIFKTQIHSSQNTLNPSLLPFVTHIIDHVQTRMRKRSNQQNSQTHVLSESSSHDSLRSVSSVGLQTPPISSSLQINFSLRIDKSTLELTCLPDVNVFAALRWESGGFVVNISPGAHKVTITGSVEGLTVGLKHGFLSEDCVNLATHNLAFSLAFAKIEDHNGNIDSSISLLVSTDIAGGIRFSRLQDILCFKAVWLDRIPLVAAQQSLGDEASPPIPSLQPSPPTSRQDITTAVIISIRRTEVTVDLGQSISVVTLNLKEALIRTRFSEGCSEVSLSVEDVAILARGNISGHMVVSDCLFQTIRRSEEALMHSSTARLLELTMTSGPLNAELDSEHQRLLVYRADPVQVDIHDDWYLISSDLGDKDRPLLLAFTVHGRGITALATIATIPKLILYANRFTASIAAQRHAASRESEAFRATQTPRPTNPLTEVASAFFQSARDRIKEPETDFSYLIRQQMSFRLEMLRLILFPRSMADAELASFVGRDVHASLHRTVQDGLPSRREIHLSFSTLNISKFSQLQPFLPSSITVSDDKAWVDSLFKSPTETNIVGLPSMKMLMITEESVRDSTTHLLFDFYSTFQGRGKRSSEDIYITLNVALYSWLTGLRKNLSREMEQLSVPTSNISVARKKAILSAPEATSIPAAAASQLDGETAQAGSSSTAPPTKLSAHLFSAPSPVTAESSSRGSEPSRAANQTTQEAKAGPSLVKGYVIYEPRERKIQRLTLRQLGEATPDVMHPFFMKTSGFSLEDSLPQYVHEYATIPLEKIMEALLNLYSKQLPVDREERNKLS